MFTVAVAVVAEVVLRSARAIINIYLDVCLVLAGEGAEHHIMIISEAINRLQEAGVPAPSAH